MKSKLTLLLILIFGIISVATVHAASLSVKMSTPKSPTNQKGGFQIGFVALDVEDRPVTVKCFIKRPGEGSFSQYDSDKNLINGGDNGSCNVGSGDLTSVGTYSFYVSATAGGDSAVSSTVNILFDDREPDAPVSYSREAFENSCKFKIKFKTADDGQTSKVILYRLTDDNLTANHDTKIAETSIGPAQNGEFVTTLPDCDKTYYFVIRAFDDAGNGSSVVGDVPSSQVSTTQTTQEEAGALPVSESESQVVYGEGTGGAILGSESPDGEDQKEGDLNGDGASTSADEQSSTDNGSDDSLFTRRNLSILLVGIALGGLFFSSFRKK